MSRCVGLAAPAGSGRCPKEVSPPRQRRDGESQHGHVHLSPTYRYASPMWQPTSLAAFYRFKRASEPRWSLPWNTCDVEAEPGTSEHGTRRAPRERWHHNFRAPPAAYRGLLDIRAPRDASTFTRAPGGRPL